MSDKTVQMIVMCTGYDLCTVRDGWMVILCDTMRKWVSSLKDMNSGIVYHW